VAFDMTMISYAACGLFPVYQPRTFMFPSGYGTLGFALPAAIGAKIARPEAAVVCVVGDGGFQYGISELATAVQHGLDAALLLIDDRGYGILRQYQDDCAFAHTGVDLEHPDFVALFEAYGVPARRSTKDDVRRDLEWALGERGPAAVVLEELLTMPEPAV
jgi:acetolactate synthase-1/2/3 large subunit